VVSFDDRGGVTETPPTIRELRDQVLAVGSDRYDNRVPTVPSLIDPLTQNWLVDACTLGGSNKLMNLQTAKYLRAEAIASGRDYMVHPLTKENLPLSTQPVRSTATDGIIDGMYGQGLQRVLDQERMRQARTLAETGHATNPASTAPAARRGNRQ
jgi:hypothetical protein